MKIAIIGGKLQATEACYLARACGMESILIDYDSSVPARGIADVFVCADVAAKDERAVKAMKEADLVLPANENDRVLEAICEICAENSIPLAFDPKAYSITKSKVISDRMMAEWGIPVPAHYPEGKAPYIIKPSGESGSTGVTYADSTQAVEEFLAKCEAPEQWVIEEYITGPSYSIEVIGVPGNYRTYAVTQIHMDGVYDCCKVTAPCPVTIGQERHFSDIGKRLAEMVNLHGIMDVEVIDDGEELKVLEIDARIPSQTPIVVLYSSGMNLLKELADVTLTGDFSDENLADVYRTDMKNSDGSFKRRYAVYEHYRRVGNEIIQEGEHSMRDAGALNIRENVLGSRVVVSDIGQELTGSEFRGIFINWADSENELDEMRKNTWKSLQSLK